jgi:quinol monooxygenase YgiN
MSRRLFVLVLPLILLVAVPMVRGEEENPIVTLVKTKVKDKDKPFGMTVTFKVNKGDEKEFADAFKAALAGTRKEPGNLGYYLNQDVEDPTTFVVFERFKSIAALEAHAKSKHVADLLPIIGPLLDGEPGVKVYGIAGE